MWPEATQKFDRLGEFLESTCIWTLSNFQKNCSFVTNQLLSVLTKPADNLDNTVKNIVNLLNSAKGSTTTVEGSPLEKYLLKVIMPVLHEYDVQAIQDNQLQISISNEDKMKLIYGLVRSLFLACDECICLLWRTQILQVIQPLQTYYPNIDYTSSSKGLIKKIWGWISTWNHKVEEWKITGIEQWRCWFSFKITMIMERGRSELEYGKIACVDDQSDANQPAVEKPSPAMPTTPAHASVPITESPTVTPETRKGQSDKPKVESHYLPRR